METSFHAGPVEYGAVALLILQGLAARFYFPIWKRRLPAPVLRLLQTTLILLSLTTIVALGLVVTGVLYYTEAIPPVPGATIIAVGYFWALISSLAVLIDLALRFLVAKFTLPYSPARRNLIGSAGIVALGAPLAVTGVGVFIERKQYRVRELDLPIAGLHPHFEGFRIVQVSDLHVSPFLSVREAGHVIDMANELRADLALFTGDLITERGDPLDDGIRELIRLRAPEGVYGCMGNHEAYVGCRNYLAQEAGRAGLRFLRGEATQIRRGDGVLNLAGVDFQSFGGNYLPGAERLAVPGVPNILLSHNPDVFPVATKKGFQTTLGGHTHGGQINVEILHRNVNPARFKTPYTSGLYTRGTGSETASCFVTNGVGTIGMPIRLGAPPEIALLRLRGV